MTAVTLPPMRGEKASGLTVTRGWQKPKPIHRAHMVYGDGSVSALCSVRPRRINLTVATWTLADTSVTCLRCLRAMSAGKVPVL